MTLHCMTNIAYHGYFMYQKIRSIWLIGAQAITLALGVYGGITLYHKNTAPLINKSADIARAATNNTPPAASLAPAPVYLSYKNSAQKAMPSVINIFVRGKQEQRQSLDPFFDWFFKGLPHTPGNLAPELKNNLPQALGSGVIVREDGYIMTNNHVVENADSIEVGLHDGRKAKARIIGTDRDTDLALLKVDERGLPAIGFGISDQVSIGDVVLAIGNPFGVGQTVTMGIISALGRKELGINTFENFIQTDAAINPGNSGGALVDAQGNLLGINTAIFTKNGGSQGIGFAIPTQTVQQVMQALMKDGEVLRGYLGISPKEVSQDVVDALGLKDQRGALVAQVFDGSPAAEAGIQAGDIITKINEQTIKSTSELLHFVAQYAPNTSVTCYVLRQQKILKFTVKLGKRPSKNKTEQFEDGEE